MISHVCMTCCAEQIPVALQDTGKLIGHTSCSVMTSSCFVSMPQYTSGFFASADEASNKPCLWDVGSGMLMSNSFEPFPSPVLQLSSSRAGVSGHSILGALSDTCLRLYLWQEP